MFGHGIGFNFGGQAKINSVYGAIISMLMWGLFYTYFVQKLQTLVFRKGPMITIAEEQDFYDDSFEFNFKDWDFKFAFAVQPAPDFGSIINKVDPDFVYWNVRIATVKDGVETFTPLTYHVCTDEDYASFYPPSKSMKIAIS